jgi:glycosyltransferase involved in cell wall biosynthesis
MIMHDKKRLKILFLPAWYPSEVNPVAGIFIKEHAKAASLYNDIVVIYAYPDPYPKPRKFYQVTENVEDGIRTIRIRYGGIILYLRNLLVKKRKENHTYSFSISKQSAFLSQLFAIPRIVINEFLYYRSIFVYFKKLVKEGWKPDIIHAHVYSAGVPSVILGKIYRIPVVITEHWTGFSLHKLILFSRIKARFAMNKAQIILPVSNDLRRHIKAYGIKNRFKIVPNVVNTEVFYPSPYQYQEAKNKSKRLLLVAALTPRKGITYLLEALNQIREKREDFILDIVGDGTNRDEYEKLARKTGLNRIVKFHGLKTKRELAEFMQQCDFFVLPSLWENLPCVLIEAMACGKPIIATNVGGIKEIINEKNGILVPSKDVGALTGAIEYMLDNYQNYSIQEIAQYARERFSYEVVGNTLNKVYRDALKIRVAQQRF